MDQEINRHWLGAVRLFNEKQFISAMMYIRKVLKKKPDHAEAALMAGNILLANKNLNNARHYFLLAKMHASTKENALLGLVALSELSLNQFEQKAFLTELTVMSPQNNLYRYHLGITALAAGDIDLAESALLECDHRHFYTHGLYLNLGHVYKAKGDTESAARLYHKYINAEKKQPAAGFWSLADLKNYTFTVDDVNKINLIINESMQSEAELSLMRFSKAKYLEQIKEFSEAAQYYQQANAVMSNLRPFKKAAFNNLIDDLIRFRPSSSRCVTDSDNPLTPIFIVGMPRSGTTLTEQILASHSQVEPTDELPYIERYAIDIQNNISYSTALTQMSEHTKAAIRKDYLNKAKRYFSSTTGYFIDKNPNNFLHIALIKLIFPEAKIVNLLRNVADNSLAVYKQFFSRGHDYSYSMTSILEYWQAYIKLMRHWDSCYPQQIYHLKFENLVSAPEIETKKLLQFIEVPFEEACLYFYKSKRAVLTPSSSQVRKPMNKKAIGQASHYEQYMPETFTQFAQLEQLVMQHLVIQQDLF
jgi:tetratricopeptide (TPR) repeat protein